MVLDGCFILELLRKAEKVVRYDPDDPFLRMAWLLPFITRDLLRLENQIPYFVLEKLFNSTKGGHQPEKSLTELALKFFNRSIAKPENALKQFNQSQGQEDHLHLLHLILAYNTKDIVERHYSRPLKFLRLIPSAKKLHQSGVKFRLKDSDTESLLDIKFNGGTLEIPKLTIDDFSASLILNFIAFEQCYGHCPRHITHYCAFLACLLRLPGDVDLLSEKHIVENYFGTNKELVHFFSNVQKEVVLDIGTCYLSKVFIEVNQYSDSQWHVKRAEFKYRYCDAPWKVISLFVGSLLLVSTLSETFYTILQYYKPRKN